MQFPGQESRNVASGCMDGTCAPEHLPSLQIHTYAQMQSSVAYGGSALLSAASAITTIAPHLAGAVDIMAVLQPDGSILSTPFYGESLKQGHMHVPWTGFQAERAAHDRECALS